VWRQLNSQTGGRLPLSRAADGTRRWSPNDAEKESVWMGDDFRVLQVQMYMQPVTGIASARACEKSRL